MEIRAKILLNEFHEGTYYLKRWSQEEGFYIEYNYNYDRSITIESKGNNLIQCIENLHTDKYNEDKLWSFKKELFSEKAEEIIKTFDLTDEEKEYMIKLGVWADF